MIVGPQYEQTVADYGEQVGLPVAGHAFVEHARAWLEAAAEAADAAFPTEAAVRLENGEPILSRLERSPVPAELTESEVELVLAACRTESGSHYHWNQNVR